MKEQIPPQVEASEDERLVMQPRRFGRLAVRATIVGAIATVAAWGAYQQFFSDSGDIKSWDPSVESQPTIDGNMVMLSWNMHNETSEKYEDIAEIAEKYDVDAIGLQEVSEADARGLHKAFPSWSINFVMADVKTKPREGGYGNVMMTLQKQEDVESLSMPGNSVPDEAQHTLGGILNLSPKEISDATQEDRSAISSTIKLNTPDGEQKIDVITGHVGGDPKVHEDQLDSFEDFVFDNEDPDKANLVCADTNTSQEEFTFDMASRGYIVPRTGPTTLPATNPPNPGKAIDMCAYKPNDIMRYSVVKVLKDYGTDHYPILFTQKQ
jgi:endonuclease/exonuclease/phosphatase family metal-dependent hydrolase